MTDLPGPPAPDRPQVPEFVSPVQPGHTSWKAQARKAGGGIIATAGLAKLAGKAFLVAKGFGVLLKFKTAGSMLLSVAGYALFWGWKFAVGFVALLFVHEVGHVVVLRAQGVKASAPMFIPFMGAFVTVEEEQRSVVEEALSALAGPAFGIVGAGAAYLAGGALGSPLLTALAYTAFLLNLFNLMPMLPLDGGRVAGAIHPYLWLVGLVAAVGFLFLHPSPVIIFVLVLGAIELVRRWRERRTGRQDAYYAVAPATRWQLATAYVLLAVVCLVGMHAAYAPAPVG
jgi:Zn-dependent protease